MQLQTVNEEFGTLSWLSVTRLLCNLLIQCGSFSHIRANRINKKDNTESSDLKSVSLSLQTSLTLTWHDLTIRQDEINVLKCNLFLNHLII